ncbi:MAG: hypothetical protein WAO02_03780 [Verrucomicrobiia bacterium]
MQQLQHGLIGHDVLERTQLADGFANHFTVSKTRQFDQERVDLIHTPRLRVQNQDAVLRRFKQPATIQFGRAQRLVGVPPVWGLTRQLDS